MSNKELIFEVVSCEERVSNRTGKPYIILNGFVDCGDRYPVPVREFSPVHLPAGNYMVPCSYVVDSRSGALSLQKHFDKAQLIRG